MTCVVGLLDKGDVWMGADSLASCGDEFVEECGVSKMFRKGPFIVGLAGSPRAKQIMQYSMDVPDHPTRMTCDEYMATRFVDALRTCLKDGGYAKKENEVEEIDSNYLVGYRGRVFVLHTDYQVATPHDEFTAIGSGRDFAHASLFTTKEMKMPPKKRVFLALKAAAKYSPSVGGPFRVMRLRGASV